MNSKGFTLVELLVTVVIIGILTWISLPQYRQSVEKSRAAEAIVVLTKLANAEKNYNNLRNTYTDDLRLLDFDNPAFSAAGTEDATGFSSKNFNFKASRATAGTFMAYAERRDANKVYTILIAVREGGDVVKWCYPGSAASLEKETVDGWQQTKLPATDGDIETITNYSQISSRLCLAIANMDEKGIISH